MLTRLCKSLKLSSKEITVFKQCVAHGVKPATFLAKQCEMPRNTVRGILDGLVQQGLLTRTRRANQHLYAPEGIEGIKRLILARREHMEAEISRQLLLLEQSVIELEARDNVSNRPKIRFYEGYEGLKRVYEDTLSAGGEICSWGSFDSNRSTLPTYFKNYYKRRAQKQIPIRSIHPDTPLAREHHKRDREELRTSLLVNQQTFNLSPEIQIYNDKVNIVSWKDRLGVLIESREIADALRAIFDLSFEGAKKMSVQARKKTPKSWV